MRKGPKASPMVKQIATERGIPESELDSIQGTGKNGSLTKQDVVDYAAYRAQNDEGELPADVDPLEQLEAETDGDNGGEMPEMDPTIELTDEDGRDEPGPSPWQEAAKEAEAMAADARNQVVDETVVVKRTAKINPMRHKRWKPDKYRIAVKRPGWKCRFVSKQNVQRYRNEGYSIATTRHYQWDGRKVGPQLSRGTSKTAIIVNNSVLMEVPDEVAKARKDYYRSMSEANLLSPTAQAVASGEIQRQGRFGGIRKRPAPGAPVRGTDPSTGEFF